MSYRCLICNVKLDTPRKLEVHLEIDHRWKTKKESMGLDKWSWF